MAARVVFVVAAARGGVIGRDGDLPWRLKSDLAFFKKTTMGKPVIMGRKTWESLPRRPLPGRLNIVVTRRAGFAADGARLASSLPEALALARAEADRTGADEIAVIGGGEIFTAALPECTRIYLTEIDLSVDGDVYLPVLDPAEWTESACQFFTRSEGDDADFVIRTLDRTKA